MGGNIKQITNKESHDAIVSHSEETNTPTVIFVYSPAKPECTKFQPRYEELPSQYPNVTFCQMEMDPETSPMIKFGPQQTPILILFKRAWCRTILGGDIKGLEEGIKGMLNG